MTKKERNMLYYQQNREKLKERARERRRERRQKALKMVKGESSQKSEPRSQRGDIQSISIFHSERSKVSDIHAETISEPGSVQNKPQLLTELSSQVNDGSKAETSQRSDQVQKFTEYTETISEPAPNPVARSTNHSASLAETMDDCLASSKAWAQQSVASFEPMEVSFEYCPMNVEQSQPNFKSPIERVQHSEGTRTETSPDKPLSGEPSTPRSDEFSSIAERVQPGSWSRPEQKPKWFKGWTDLIGAILSAPATLLRLLFVGGLTCLLTVLQVAFYREHDIDPSLAIPLALACELSLISLVMMSCRSRLENLLRCAAYAVLFGYVIGSLGFDIMHNMRQRAQQVQLSPAALSTTMENIQSRLEQAQRSLDAATKGRSWDNMVIFGKQVDELQAQIDDLQSQNLLGFSEAEMIQGSMILIVLLRAVIMIVNSINLHRLKCELIPRLISARSQMMG